MTTSYRRELTGVALSDSAKICNSSMVVVRTHILRRLCPVDSDRFVTCVQPHLLREKHGIFG